MINSSYQLDDEFDRDIATYTWDNYILYVFCCFGNLLEVWANEFYSLENPPHVILIGQGQGCDMIMDLLEARSKKTCCCIKNLVDVVRWKARASCEAFAGSYKLSMTAPYRRFPEIIQS